MRGPRIGLGGAGAARGSHGMHGLLAGTAATVVLAATFVTGAGAVEAPTIPTAPAGVAAPRCTVGQPCTFAAPIFACDYAGAERIAVAGPAKGGEVGAGLVREAICQTVPAGRPFGTEVTKSALVVYLTEGGQHLGYAPVGVFAPPGTTAQADSYRPGSDASSQAAGPQLRDTARLSDIVFTANRSPDSSAIELSGQGTGAATGVFRSGPRERRTFCRGYWAEDQVQALRSCLSEPDETITVRANCHARNVSFNGRRYGLFERPRGAAPDIHTDERRRMLYRDLNSGEWLDGSTVSGEVTVRSALAALCPGVDPEASYGLVYRDPGARYPRELWGRWFDSRRACADPGRDAPDYEGHGVMEIAVSERRGNRAFEFPQCVNAVRRVGERAWQIDGSHRIDSVDVPEIFGSAPTP